MLREKLQDKNNILISLEPLLEGKLEIIDMMELFYLKLYQKVQDDKIKNVIKNSLKSLVFFRFKITANSNVNLGLLGFPVNVGATAEYNLGKNIDDFLTSLNKDGELSFTEQAKKINKKLNKYKIFVFIDEIDRLPASYIINFLLFCRTLELFENLTCIVAIDYEQVIQKLIKENFLCDYRHAQGYLDKIFQIKFQVQHNNITKMNFGLDLLEKLDTDKIIEELLNDENEENYQKIDEIFNYLNTPRQIKKWLISVKANYFFIKCVNEKIIFMSFLAVITKHPIILDNISKYMIPVWDTHQNNKRKLLSLAGLINYQNFTEERLSTNNSYQEESKRLEKEIADLGIDIIRDNYAANCISSYLQLPKSLILCFIEGYIDKDEIDIFQNLGTPNLVINSLLKGKNKQLACDLIDFLLKNNLEPHTSASPKLLNKLWNKVWSIPEKAINPYKRIVTFYAKFNPIEESINENYLSISEFCIQSLLEVFNIQNRNGVYDIEKFSINTDKQKKLKKLTFNRVNISNFDKKTLTEILHTWIDKVEHELTNHQDSCQELELSIFYRYIQWSHSLEIDNKDKLAKLVTPLFKDKKCNSLKTRLIHASQQYDTLLHDLFGNSIKDIESLLDP